MKPANPDQYLYRRSSLIALGGQGDGYGDGFGFGFAASTESIDEFRFLNCIVRKSTREIILDGTLQSVEPKTFDLVWHLIENRARVVNRADLLQSVWGPLVVSDSAISQCVMKARRVVGDESGNSLIKTIHRVGYRFVADVRTVAKVVQTGRASTEVAWLPTQNCSGRPEMAWITLGLISIAAGVLKLDGLQPYGLRRIAEVFDLDASSSAYAEQVASARNRMAGVATVSSSFDSVGDHHTFEWTVRFARKEMHRKLTGSSPVALVTRADHETCGFLREVDASTRLAGKRDRYLVKQMESSQLHQ